MKLYHGQYILPALGLFLVAATLPVWRGAASRGPGFHSPPNPKGERCIEPKDIMRAEHMRMLLRWRDGAVREGNRVYLATDGRHWEKSLKTCVACHGHADARGVEFGEGLGLMQERGEKPAGIDVIASKPITIDGLRRAMHQALGPPAPPSENDGPGP